MITNSVPLLWAYQALLATHWVGDFVVQTNWQAANKSKNNRALLHHVLFYTGCLGATSAVLFFPGMRWLIFIIGNGALHFATDYWTSRWSAPLFEKQDLRKFFMVVGFDQLIHQVTLGITLWLVFYR